MQDQARGYAPPPPIPLPIPVGSTEQEETAPLDRPNEEWRDLAYPGYRDDARARECGRLGEAPSTYAAKLDGKLLLIHATRSLYRKLVCEFNSCLWRFWGRAILDQGPCSSADRALASGARRGRSSRPRGTID